jgi:hypothetical protein
MISSGSTSSVLVSANPLSEQPIHSICPVGAWREGIKFGGTRDRRYCEFGKVAIVEELAMMVAD